MDAQQIENLIDITFPAVEETIWSRQALFSTDAGMEVVEWMALGIPSNISDAWVSIKRMSHEDRLTAVEAWNLMTLPGYVHFTPCMLKLALLPDAITEGEKVVYGLYHHLFPCVTYQSSTYDVVSAFTVEQRTAITETVKSYVFRWTYPEPQRGFEEIWKVFKKYSAS